jgi:hypothetical protein
MGVTIKCAVLGAIKLCISEKVRGFGSIYRVHLQDQTQLAKGDGWFFAWPIPWS